MGRNLKVLTSFLGITVYGFSMFLGYALLPPQEEVQEVQVAENNLITTGEPTAGVFTAMSAIIEQSQAIVEEKETIVVSEEIKEFEVYALANVNIRKEPAIGSSVIRTIYVGTIVNGYYYDENWFYCVEEEGYISADWLVKCDEYLMDDGVLNSYDGVAYGPSGVETYYNLPMGKVIEYMEALGYYADYWVDNRGFKMYGDYIMIAMDLSKYPKGTKVMISAGKAIVCDTGGFVTNGSGVAVDVCVDW